MTRTATLRRSEPKGRRARRGDLAGPHALDALGDQRFVIHDLPWESYVAINDAIVGRPRVRMFYCDGRLTLLTESRKHGWYSQVSLSTSSSPWPMDSKSTWERRRFRDLSAGEEER